MRKNTLAGAVAFGIAGLFIVGGVANADQGPGTDVVGKVSVDKKSYKAGDVVDVSGECHKAGSRDYTVTSPAFASAVKVVDPQTDFFAGKTKVGKDVKPGSYAVSFQCGGQAISTKVTVVATEKKQVKPVETTKKESGQVAVKPKGSANTGGGDVVAAPAQESGSNTGLYVLGGAGLLAAGGAGAFMLRRRSRTQN
ncbi:hypothetical protein ALI144C_12320 [Actinosynnema sp. ALI-1.44]|uniref:hypothetical protein n=1 Tax=Actinosynnema sp. ALI-1.44 TaxID=1933779 RepID=UPI00097C5920|nr:hypothetical protein [Actinosynnema sp. ALI-1.44]ONI85888.1 hypothetical protein ALI144C_12320 [Actinosynnema sp. ALI-1.44]